MEARALLKLGKKVGTILGRNSLNSRLHKGSPPCARPARSTPNGYLAVVPSSVRCTADSARATTVPLGSGTPGANRSHSDEKLGGGALRHLCMWTACTIASSRSESGATCARHTSSKLAAKPTTSLAASVFSGRSLPTGNGWRTRQFAGLCMASRRIGPRCCSEMHREIHEVRRCSETRLLPCSETRKLLLPLLLLLLPLVHREMYEMLRPLLLPFLLLLNSCSCCCCASDGAAADPPRQPTGGWTGDVPDAHGALPRWHHGDQTLTLTLTP